MNKKEKKHNNKLAPGGRSDVVKRSSDLAQRSLELVKDEVDNGHDISPQALCDLVAEKGAQYARENKDVLVEVIKESTGRVVSTEQEIKIFKIFSFLNWAYANGVWSNLSDTGLRRELMEKSLTSIVLRTSHELSADKSDGGIASFAVDVDRELREYVFAYNKRIKELSEQGYDIDANSVTLYGMEGIQGSLTLNDDEMSIIVVEFYNRGDDVARIQTVADRFNAVDYSPEN